MKPKFFIGPMSKNIVDATVEFCNNTNNVIGLIPSRRQIEYNNGYVNNWSTEDFSLYVKSKTNNILLVRDHSGAGQGQNDIDDEYESLTVDCKYLDVIHIDPWKRYTNFSDGLNETINMINYCYNLNTNIQYEVGTEESIRPFNTEELNDLMEHLKYRLDINVFNQIKYLVIQSGTSLKGVTQTGNYDSKRLLEMLDVCKKYNVIAKEHNGDYIPITVIKEKFGLGLACINVAPEFGLIETQTYLDNIQDEETLFDFWDICYKSGKWKKWVNSDFDPINDKIELIKICGHYVLSYPEFLGIKKKFPYINEEIKKRVIHKLNNLYGY